MATFENPNNYCDGHWNFLYDPFPQKFLEKLRLLHPRPDRLYPVCPYVRGFTFEGTNNHPSNAHKPQSASTIGLNSFSPAVCHTAGRNWVRVPPPPRTSRRPPTVTPQNQTSRASPAPSGDAIRPRSRAAIPSISAHGELCRYAPRTPRNRADPSMPRPTEGRFPSLAASPLKFSLPFLRTVRLGGPDDLRLARPPRSLRPQ
jgi:hypothetical protein